MLSVKNRISSKDHTSLKGGLLYNTSLFTLRVHEIEKQKQPRFSVIVSKKIANKAVDRNKIKRKVHSVLSENIKKIKKPHSYVIWVKEEALKANYLKIKEDIVFLFKKSNLL